MALSWQSVRQTITFWPGNTDTNLMRRIEQKGEEFEYRMYDFLAAVFRRLVRALYLFKTRKSEVMAAAATFFLVLSFPTVLSLTLYSVLKLGNTEARAMAILLDMIRELLPNSSETVIDYFGAIARVQLQNLQALKLVNLFLLFYSCIGIAATMNFGLSYLMQKGGRGGMIFDHVRALVSGSVIGAFIIVMLALTSNSPLVAMVLHKTEYGALLLQLQKMQVLSATLTLVFFCLYYKLLNPFRIRFNDALWGACAFIGLVATGKSLYWVYLHYEKKDLIDSFGEFSTVIVPLVWVYFLFGSFFYGAAVAVVPSIERKADNLTDCPANNTDDGGEDADHAEMHDSDEKSTDSDENSGAA